MTLSMVEARQYLCESAEYSPFFTDYGRLPRLMIWNNPEPTEYLYAQKLQHSIASAHDSMIAARRVEQTRDANRRSLRPCPLEKGDFVNLSTKNINCPKGLAGKFLPKFVGPYRILNGSDFGNN
jgi:hypothetical protein